MPDRFSRSFMVIRFILTRINSKQKKLAIMNFFCNKDYFQNLTPNPSPGGEGLEPFPIRVLASILSKLICVTAIFNPKFAQMVRVSTIQI